VKKDPQVWSQFAQAFNGDPAAIALLENVCELTNIWDDLIDKDNGEVSTESINRAFWIALVEMPENPFYARHYQRLAPILRVGIHNWLASNKFERSGDERLIDLAHVARYSVGDIVLEMLLIIGGYRWAEYWTPILKPLIAPETRTQYLESLKNVA
jgi:hypothetical protein